MNKAILYLGVFIALVAIGAVIAYFAYFRNHGGVPIPIKGLPKITSFVATPASVNTSVPSESSAVLSWTVSGASKVTLSPYSENNGDVTALTSVTVQPTATTTYTLTATEGPLKASKSATVTVVSVPSNNTPSGPKVPPTIAQFTALPSATPTATTPIQLNYLVQNAAQVQIQPANSSTVLTGTLDSDGQGTVQYTPPATATGALTFSMTATSPSGGTATTTSSPVVQVASSQPAVPVVAPLFYSTTDVNGNPVFYSVNSPPPVGTLVTMILKMYGFKPNTPISVQYTIGEPDLVTADASGNATYITPNKFAFLSTTNFTVSGTDATGKPFDQQAPLGLLYVLQPSKLGLDVAAYKPTSPPTFACNGQSAENCLDQVGFIYLGFPTSAEFELSSGSTVFANDTCGQDFRYNCNFVYYGPGSPGPYVLPSSLGPVSNAELLTPYRVFSKSPPSIPASGFTLGVTLQIDSGPGTQPTNQANLPSVANFTK
jgi:hypothetical protein